MKKILLRGMIVFIGLLGFFLFQPSIAFGQSFVLDEAGVLSKEAIEEINNLNEKGFQHLTGSPEYAVITIPSLDGQSIEEKTTNLFNEYGLGNSEDNNGLLFLFAIEEREFRLGYGDGLNYIFSDLSEDDLVDKDTKDALRDEDYDTAIAAASTEVYQRMKEAEETIGLETIYLNGNQLLAQKRTQEAQAMKKMWLNVGKIISGIVATIVVGVGGFIGFRRLKTKWQFEQHFPLPTHLLEDKDFQGKAFLKWASYSKNYQIYNQYHTERDCQMALTYYLTTAYIPEKVKAISGLMIADKRWIQQGFINSEISDLFTSLLIKKKTNVSQFGLWLLDFRDTLENYEAQLIKKASDTMANYDLTDEILPENMELIDVYRAEIVKQAKDEVKRRSENNCYLARLVTDQVTHLELIRNISQEVYEIIEKVKIDALFEVDLKQVYKIHPELASKLSDFDASDQVDVLNNVRNEYNPGMNMILLFALMNNHMTHQEQVIADTQGNNDSFGGFSGGSSSGGGVSGSW
ncbi:hypothetical protein A5886_001703 [Enterococcus sp. 8G7_MSG3316]|uniref:TPM domain-containing protein n=1 Tax=Candidatus Enterococcus testudinis TaxID=1834191 RepID=A0A242A6G1_9ENTE|nr:TPM domain-containing protein [Enterococcus sp. 8G7_MSG3316]OTN76625.1 hypothetical protein A5886_001703 [Enterococcus sp. 8G7_MSG3316]